jgi:hypothetical protein
MEIAETPLSGSAPLQFPLVPGAFSRMLRSRRFAHFGATSIRRMDDRRRCVMCQRKDPGVSGDGREFDEIARNGGLSRRENARAPT